MMIIMMITIVITIMRMIMKINKLTVYPEHVIGN